ncbi:MAG: hypothetical protein ACRDTT_21970, partial [Pseudonocardiaceae bacterium]
MITIEDPVAVIVPHTVGKMLDDQRNTGHTAALHRFAAALSTTTATITLGRGQLLTADQQRIAHGRT